MTTAPPTILFMGRIFEVPWGGVREMAESLLKAAAPIAHEQGREIQVLVPREGLCPVQAPTIREVVLPRFGTNRILWDHWTVSNYANTQTNAVLYNVKLVLPERLKIPGFTTIHDLMYFPQPEKYDWREYLLGDSIYMRAMVRRTVRRAPLTHTDSINTADDARALFPNVPPDRFRPVHIAIEHERYTPGVTLEDDAQLWRDIESKGLKRPYVLHTGGLSRRKNIVVLAKAFAKFHNSHPDYQLVVTGGSKPTVNDPELESALSSLPEGSFVKLGLVSPRALVLLYQRAEFFVFPSLYEGFGLPPLEAQAAGCPVICSNSSSLPEVMNDSALMFDPTSTEQLANHMNSMTEPELRATLIENGLKNAATFTWNKTANEWLSLCDEVAANKK